MNRLIAVIITALAIAILMGTVVGTRFPLGSQQNTINPSPGNSPSDRVRGQGFNARQTNPSPGSQTLTPSPASTGGQTAVTPTPLPAASPTTASPSPASPTPPPPTASPVSTPRPALW